MLLSLMKTQFLKLENAFAPGMSTITWLSQNVNDFIKFLDATLYDVEGFLNREINILNNRIEAVLNDVEVFELIAFPTEPISTSEFYETNSDFRVKQGRRLEAKSQAIEKSVIELINNFIEIIHVSDVDDHGRRKFQLPYSQIDETNWRIENPKPIDKYDWISFEKIYKAVSFPAPEEQDKMRFKDYDGLKYDVTLLHIDAMELFAYYNQRMIAALVRCTKTSLEHLKDRSRTFG